MVGAPGQWARYFFWGILFLNSITLQAQYAVVPFQKFGMDEGLPNHNVFAIAQDHEGFLWIGTEDGLVRYDGYDFQLFNHSPGDETTLSGDDITTLMVDAKGRLWIGAWGAGLNSYTQQDGFTRYGPDQLGVNHPSGIRVQCLMEDSLGMIWIGSASNGVIRLDPETGETHVFRIAEELDHPKNRILSLTESESGNIWAGTSRGLLNLDPNSGAWIELTLPEELKTIQETSIKALHWSRTGALWIGSEGGLHRYNPRTKTVRYFSKSEDGMSGSEVNLIVEDKRNFIWIGTADGGLNRWNGQDQMEIFTMDNGAGLPNNDIRAAVLDRTDVLWIGVLGGGLLKLDRKPAKFDLYQRQENQPRSLSHPQVRAITTDAADNIWVGSGDGLDYVDRIKRQITQHKHNPADPDSLWSNDITALAWFPAGKLWAGSTKGLNTLENGVIKRVKTPSIVGPVTALFAGETQGSLWIGTENGLHQYDGQTFKSWAGQTRVRFTQEDISAIYEDKTGIVWVGTRSRGLNRFDPDTTRVTQMLSNPNNDRTLSNDSILAIHEFLDFIWIGTRGGLNRLNRGTGEFIHYERGPDDIKNALPSSTITAISDDGRGYLWLSTPKGICRFEPYTADVRRYDKYDGLQGNQFLPGSVHRSAAGELFFGGVNGFNGFLPQLVQDNLFPPKVAVTQIKIPTRNDANFAGTKYLELTHLDTVIQFEFASLDFTMPAKNRFRYFLEGLDDDWSSPTSIRMASYTNLSPGTYRFHVRASNNDGYWSRNDDPIEIIVRPPWYKHPIAILIYIIVGIAAMVRLVQYFRGLERARAEKVIVKETERLREEAQRAKKAFLSNMSHELRTPLTAIIGYTELLQEESADLKDRRLEHFAPDLARIKSSAYHQLATVTNLLELSKLEAGQTELYLSEFKIVPEIEEVLARFKPLLSENKNSFFLDVHEGIESMRADRIKVQDILTNLLSNAHKFTNNGEISLSVRRKLTLRQSGQEREWVLFNIQDSGIGMEQSEIKHLFDAFHNPAISRRNAGAGLGMELSYRFCKMMGGDMRVESQPNKGTTVEVKLPTVATQPSLNTPN